MVDITEHLRLVEWVIDRRFSRRVRGRIERDDLVQVGREGLLRAARTFDPSLGTFCTYAAIWVTSYILRYLKDRGRLVRVPTYLQDTGRAPLDHVVSLDSPVRDDDSERVSLVRMGGDTIGQDDGDLSRAANHLDVKRLLALIPDERQRSVVSAYYIGGLTLGEITQGLRCTRETARQLILRGVSAARAGMRWHDRARLQPAPTTLKIEPRRAS